MDKYNVIVVDDNKVFCELATFEIARTDDMQLVGIAHNTNDGMELIKDVQPDLVILDNVFAGPYCDNDGIGLLMELNKQRLVKRPKILMISSLTSNDVLANAADYGADYVMNRGVPLDTILDRGRMLLKKINNPAYPNESASAVLGEDFKELNDFQIMTNMLHKLGVPANIKGYEYLRRAVLIAIEDPSTLSGITKVLYPQIASEYNTDASNVERAIRHAVKTSWERCDSRILSDLFQPIMDKKKCKPTNSEVIATLSQHILQYTKWRNEDECM